MPGLSRDVTRIALLVGDTAVPRWFARSVRRLLDDAEVTLPLLVVPSTPEKTTHPEKDLAFYMREVQQKGSWLPVGLAQRVASHALGPIPELERVPLKGIVDDELTELRTELKPAEGLGYNFSTEAVEKIESSADLALHWGVGVLKGNVLSAPTYGVVGAHHGDIRAYRGGPPGFWEYVNREPTATVTIQRYTEQLDGGELLAERVVSIDDAPTWRAVRRRLCRATPPAMVEAVRTATDDSRSPTSVEDLGPVYSGDDRDLGVTIRYVSRTVPGWLRTALD